MLGHLSDDPVEPTNLRAYHFSMLNQEASKFFIEGTRQEID